MLVFSAGITKYLTYLFVKVVPLRVYPNVVRFSSYQECQYDGRMKFSVG